MSIKSSVICGLYPMTLLLVFLCFIDELSLYVCLSILFLIYGLIRFRFAISLLFLIGAIYFCPFPVNESPSFLYNQFCVVKEIKTKSYLIGCDGINYYLSNDYSLTIGDKLIVDGAVSSMDRPISYFGFDQDSYDRAHDIGGYIGKADVEIIGMRFSFQRLLMQFIKWCNPTHYMDILHILWMNKQNNTVLVFSSFIYITLIQWITRVLAIFVEDTKLKKIEYCMVISVGLLMGFNFLLLRQLVSPWVKKIHPDKDIRFSITIIIWLFLNNGYVNSLSFVYPFCYLWFNLINDKRSFWQNTLLNFFIQGIYLNQVSLLNLLGFNMMRNLSSMAFIVQFMATCLNIPLSFPYFNALQNMLIIPSNPIGIGLLIYWAMASLMRYLPIKNLSILQCCLYLFFAYFGLFHPLPSVTFINVGQGDSILIKSAWNKTKILVDTGKENAYEQVQDLLKGYGIRKLDALIITHQDSDHCDNKEVIVHEYNVNTLIESDFDIKEINDIWINNLNHNQNEADTNASSLVLLFNIDDCSFLLPGDIPQNIEETIIRQTPVAVDILKASHHGSKTGSSDLFLDTLHPSFIIYSAGSPSIYNHPSNEVIQKALKRHLLQMNTFLDGDITFSFLHPFILVNSASGLISLMVK